MADRYRDVLVALSGQLNELREIAERKTLALQTDVSARVLPVALQVFIFEAMINLTSYTATGSRPRDPAIEEAFWLLKFLVGFQYNRKGSFTWEGANEILNKDATFRLNRFRLQAKIEGRLEDLENGDVNWNSLRRFFYSGWVQTAIKKAFPNFVDGFYSRLGKLFKHKKDPTESGGRPYISQAAEYIRKEHMHEAIKQSVIRVFGTESDDGWVRTK